MYLLTWNPEQNRIEASFGGFISNGEAIVFQEELTELLREKAHQLFNIMVDYATASRLDDKVRDILEECRESAIFAGAAKVIFVTRDDSEAHAWTDNRLQQVLEGREEYVAFGVAA